MTPDSTPYPDAARLVARDDHAVRWSVASTLSQQAGGARLRLRGSQRTDAGANVRPPLSPLRRYRLHDSASRNAVPGWPADVPLPSIPTGKSQYAASVRRLVRDGVDSPFGETICPCCRNPALRCRLFRSSAKCNRGISRSPIGNISRDGREVSLECRAADSVRCWAAWKSTCFASRRTSPSNLTAGSTWATLKPTGEIVARMLCCRRMAIGSSLPRRRRRQNV